MRHVLEREQFIARPRSEVFAFFADAANLERLTPSSLRFEIKTTTPIEMRPGTLIEDVGCPAADRDGRAPQRSRRAVDHE